MHLWYYKIVLTITPPQDSQVQLESRSTAPKSTSRRRHRSLRSRYLPSYLLLVATVLYRLVPATAELYRCQSLPRSSTWTRCHLRTPRRLRTPPRARCPISRLARQEHVKRHAVSLTPDQKSTRSGSRQGEGRSGLRRSKRQAEIGAANGYIGQNKIDWLIDNGHDYRDSIIVIALSFI